MAIVHILLQDYFTWLPYTASFCYLDTSEDNI